MFGQLLDLLACKKFSDARNRLAHEVDKGFTHQNIQTIASKFTELDESISDFF